MKWNEYTMYSKWASILFFIIILPALSFYIGSKYQETKNILSNLDSTTITFEKQNITSSSTVNWNIEYELKDFQGYKMPQLINYPNKDIMQKVNNQLAEIVNSYGCKDVLSSPNNNFNSNIKVTYSKNYIFSLSIHNSWYCQGPYPTNDSNESITFDMLSGNQISFEKLFSDYKGDKKKIIEIVFEDLIKHTSDENNGSCKGFYSLDQVDSGYDRADFSEFIAYFIEGDGVTAQPVVAHVSEACSRESHVSVDKLKSFYSSSSILNRIN